MELSNFPHYVLINASGKKFKDFSDDLKTELASFEKTHKGWMLKKDPKTLPNLIARSKILTQFIYDYFVESEDQSVDNPGDNPQAAAADIIDNADAAPVDNNPPADPVIDQNAQFEATLNKNELVVHKMYMAGVIAGVTKEQLRGYGYDTGFMGPLSLHGARHKYYSVVRDSRHPGLVYNIVKHG